jgi:peptide deformylase
VIKEILDAQNPSLRRPSKAVSKIDKKVRQVIGDLIDTLSVQNDPEGVGLAAPQIGKNLKIFIMKPKKDAKVVINPEIVRVSKIKKTHKPDKKKSIMEGCLSLPHYYSPIKRSPKVTLKYMDELGNEKTETFEGMDAQIIQHEVDHLNGVLFIDRLLEQKKPLFEYVEGEWEQVDLAQ